MITQILDYLVKSKFVINKNFLLRHGVDDNFYELVSPFEDNVKFHKNFYSREVRSMSLFFDTESAEIGFHVEKEKQ